VAEYVVDGISNDTFWILPDKRHPDVQSNFDAIIRVDWSPCCSGAIP